jgi:hypothetical protein
MTTSANAYPHALTIRSMGLSPTSMQIMPRWSACCNAPSRQTAFTASTNPMSVFRHAPLALSETMILESVWNVVYSSLLNLPGWIGTTTFASRSVLTVTTLTTKRAFVNWSALLVLTLMIQPDAVSMIVLSTLHLTLLSWITTLGYVFTIVLMGLILLRFLSAAWPPVPLSLPFTILILQLMPASSNAFILTTQILKL